MMDHVRAAFDRAHDQGRLALVGYLPAAWPSVAGFAELADAAFCAGIDVLEVGVPSPDPFLDGDVIRDAMVALAAAGIGAERAIEAAGASAGPGRPLVAMMYRDDWLGLGGAASSKSFASLGYSGMLVVGARPGDWAVHAPASLASGLAPIAFASSRDGLDETGAVAKMAGDAGGFVYLPSYRGKTGRKASFDAALGVRIASVRGAAAGLPVAVGFGINAPSDVAALAGLGADGAIIGTAFLKASANPEGLAAFVRSLVGAAAGIGVGGRSEADRQYAERKYAEPSDGASATEGKRGNR